MKGVIDYMNLNEAIKLVAIAVASFPNTQDKDMKSTAIAWSKVLSDLPSGIAEAALVKVLNTSKFFPTLAEIREAATEIQNGGLSQITGGEAWAKVTRAIYEFSISRYNPEDVKDAHAYINDRTISGAVQTFGGLIAIAESEDPESVMRGQFIRVFENIVKREKEEAMIPDYIKEFAENNRRELRDGKPKELGKVLSMVVDNK